MAFFKKMFGAKSAVTPDQIVHVMKQSQAVIDQSMDLAEYENFTPPIEGLWVELLTANPDHTPIRIQAVVCAVAQLIGLHVWSEYGERISEDKQIPLAQAVLNFELINQISNLTPGGAMYEIFGQLIVEQTLSLQVSAPLSVCQMGQEELARQMVAKTKQIALLPDDNSLSRAMQQA